MQTQSADPSLHIRPAQPRDAEFVLDLSLIAAHGFLPHFFNQIMPEGQDLRAFMLDSVRDPLSKMSYAKCRIALLDGVPGGMINLDPIPLDPPQPDPDLPAMFHPLAALEAQSPGTTVIEFLATLPQWRGRGLGRALLDQAERERGPNGVSLVVSDNNTSARRVYERAGFVEVARRRIVHQGWESPGKEWILMHRT